MNEPAPSPVAVPTASGAEAPPSRRRRMRGVRIGAFAAAGALLITAGAAGGAWGATHLAPSSGVADTSSAIAGRGPFPGGSGGFRSGGGSGSSSGSSTTTEATGPAATAAQEVGVVTIDTTLAYEGAAAAGTGIVLTSSGEILTNNHVIAGATSIRVTVESTDRTYTAKVVGTDATDDVAVLQLQGASGLQTATLANAAAAEGDAVTAIGNAGGTGELTTATGTVTDLGQTITTAAEGSAASETLEGLIETDADVVAGDSGGPLVNTAGAVVGIDTAASTGTRRTQSYAIPIASALAVARQIEAGESSSTITIGYPAFLGIEVAQDATADGAGVAGVIDGTPAASVGLAEGDVITAVDGTSIGSASDLTAALGDRAAGDRVTITWTGTDGASHTAQVVLVDGPAD